MDAKNIRHEARAAMNGSWGTGVLMSLLMALFTLVSGALEIVNEDGTYTATLLSVLFSVFFTNVVGYGYTVLFLKLYRGGKIGVGDMFSGFSSYMKVVGTALLKYLYTFLWSLLLIVPGIIKSLSYSLTYYIMNDDPALSYNAAISKSRQMMAGHKGELFHLWLTFIGWWLLAILSLGIAGLWVGPYFNATMAKFYLKVSQQ